MIRSRLDEQPYTASSSKSIDGIVPDQYEQNKESAEVWG